ncbi:hypothetical protein GCM10025787_38710 [Saccharopolyspora rosea]|uniref:Peptidase inhibitor family I36 protein n=1 Tax=Saccharopolyspora rosea TaxID=524884 RepID=A0ABW3FKL2_9PSEU
MSTHVLTPARRFRPTRFSSTGRTTALTLLVLAFGLFGAGWVNAAPPPEKPCPAGSFCAWSGARFDGERHVAGLQTTAVETCVALPEGLEARSFRNDTGKPVTVYQDPTCATNAEFATYPTGSQANDAPFVARAIKIWSH